MNKVFLIGNLTADPEIRTVAASNATVTTFTLAVNTRTKDAQGNEITNFYRITAWRQLGETCAKFLHKGNRCAVTGNLVVTTYTNKNGQPSFSLDVTADGTEFLTPKNENAAAPAQTAPAQGYRAPAPAPVMPGADDDLPF